MFTLDKRTRRFSPPPNLPPLGGGAARSLAAGEGWREGVVSL